MKEKINKTVLVLVVALCIVACSKERRMNYTDVIRYFEDNKKEFVVEKKIGLISYKLMYQPAVYKAAHSIQRGTVNSQTELQTFLIETGGLHYFTLEIENLRSETDVLQEGASGQEEYMSRINYFSYAFCNDIKLTSGTDTVDCALFHYENSYGGTPVARFLLAFDDKKIGEDKTLIISDKIFNKGKIKLNMDKKVFDELPILNF